MIIISFWASQGGRLRLDDGLLLQPWTEFHMLCRHLHVVVSETSVRRIRRFLDLFVTAVTAATCKDHVIACCMKTWSSLKAGFLCCSGNSFIDLAAQLPEYLTRL
jgi:hypothetical protein